MQKIWTVEEVRELRKRVLVKKLKSEFMKDCQRDQGSKLERRSEKKVHCRYEKKDKLEFGNDCKFLKSRGPNQECGGKKSKLARDCSLDYKTSLCRAYSTNQRCNQGERCTFAHGDQDLRQSIKVCQNWEAGFCKFGENCRFTHNEDITLLQIIKNKKVKNMVPDSNLVFTFQEERHNQLVKMQEEATSLRETAEKEEKDGKSTLAASKRRLTDLTASYMAGSRGWGDLKGRLQKIEQEVRKLWRKIAMAEEELHEHGVTSPGVEAWPGDKEKRG